MTRARPPQHPDTERDTTLTQASKLLGKHPNTLKQWIETHGMPATPSQGRGHPIKVSIPEIIDWLIVNAHRAGIRPRHNSGDMQTVDDTDENNEPDSRDYWDKERIKADAHLKRDKLARERGHLIPAQQAIGEMMTLAITMASGLDRLGSRLAVRVANEPNAPQCKQIIDEGVAPIKAGILDAYRTLHDRASAAAGDAGCADGGADPEAETDSL